VWRYLPFAPVEVENSTATLDSPNRLVLLTTNVLQTSRGSDALLEIVVRTNPDLVLAVETDEWWCARLAEGLSGRFPNKVLYPLSNGYGMALFSRLELVEPSIRFLVDDAVPSIRTRIRLRSAALIDLYGLHPQPPAPLQDSTQRDAELVLVGMEIARKNRPAVVLGDLNDVAWSPTTSRFKQVGRLVDPRRGRGFFNTYPARLPGLRYPLDYVFHTPHFAVSDMQVLPRFQSDHLALAVSLALKT
jgi:endonuclease/exonuclease/phosphatase (EEP) superfamily protein YafD